MDSLAHDMADYAFQRDQQEFSLGDTLDIKTGLVLAVALTFLAIQSGEMMKPGESQLTRHSCKPSPLPQWQ